MVSFFEAFQFRFFALPPEPDRAYLVFTEVDSDLVDVVAVQELLRAHHQVNQQIRAFASRQDFFRGLTDMVVRRIRFDVDIEILEH